MAKARALDRRRRSIRNIRRITRTMELISTARFRRALNRAIAATAYTERITALVGDIVRSGLRAGHPLLERRGRPERATLLVLSANRGMCGGYNAAVLRRAFARWEELSRLVPHRRLEVSGRRGISACRFRHIQPDETFTHFEDKPNFEEVEVLADRYIEAFKIDGLDRLEVVYTKFETAGRQRAVVETLLPLSEMEELKKEQPQEAPAAVTEYEFLPSAESVLCELVPSSFKVKLFKCFLDAAVSEQIARMVAMKTAAENAEAMISHLTMAYNRARQGQITSELLEVVSGAEALES